MPPTPDPACRQIYLLSLWRETPEAPWRAALRLAGSEQRMGFADLDALALFLLRLDEHPERPAVVLDCPAAPIDQTYSDPARTAEPQNRETLVPSGRAENQPP